MSSNPATEPSRPGWLRRLRSPRAWALHRFWMGQLDEQVIGAGHRSATIYDLGPPPPPPPGSPRRTPPFDPGRGPGPAFLDAPGQATHTVGAVAFNGVVVNAGVITSNGSRAASSNAAARQLARIPPNSRPATVNLDGLGRYRVVARPSRTGIAAVVSGLPMSS